MNKPPDQPPPNLPPYAYPLTPSPNAGAFGAPGTGAPPGPPPGYQPTPAWGQPAPGQQPGYAPYNYGQPPGYQGQQNPYPQPMYGQQVGIQPYPAFKPTPEKPYATRLAGLLLVVVGGMLTALNAYTIANENRYYIKATILCGPALAAGLFMLITNQPKQKDAPNWAKVGVVLSAIAGLGLSFAIFQWACGL